MRGAAINEFNGTIVTAISTHAPHARRGLNSVQYDDGELNFYSRASCEARQSSGQQSQSRDQFLLTRLMRGAAIFTLSSLLFRMISTHAPHARRGPLVFCRETIVF